MFPAPLSKSATKQWFPIRMSILVGRKERTLFTRCWGLGRLPPFGPTVLSVVSSFPDLAGYPARSGRDDLSVEKEVCNCDADLGNLAWNCRGVLENLAENYCDVVSGNSVWNYYDVGMGSTCDYVLFRYKYRRYNSAVFLSSNNSLCGDWSSNRGMRNILVVVVIYSGLKILLVGGYLVCAFSAIPRSECSCSVVRLSTAD